MIHPSIPQSFSLKLSINLIYRFLFISRLTEVLSIHRSLSFKHSLSLHPSIRQGISKDLSANRGSRNLQRKCETNSTGIRTNLIRTVHLGPFKHIVDDGLELRKASFECVDTLLDSCLDQVNPSSFIGPSLESGLDG